jgi:iron complex transport system permease protein
MGNIKEKELSVLWISAVCILTGIIVLFTVCHRLNVLALGQEEAKALGVNVARTRIIAFACAAFITAIAVSLSGLIGFVGLIIPHGVRLTFGPDHRQLLPLSAIIGAAFLIIADTLARIIVAPAQLPVGVITAITGGPFFLILLAKYSRKVSWLK